MESITTVTQKGQITLFKTVRDQYGLVKNSQVRIVASDGHIKLYPVRNILDMVGSVKPIKGRSALKAREWMEKHYKRA